MVPDLAQLLATRFLILQHSMTSTAEQIKKVTINRLNAPLSLG